ncbi:hypothetical protein V6N13_057797 [Hibiscus sabdariffa]
MPAPAVGRRLPALPSVVYHRRPPFEATAAPKSDKDADEDLLPLVLDVLNEAEKIGLDYMDVEALKKLNKNKKENSRPLLLTRNH